MKKTLIVTGGSLDIDFARRYVTLQKFDDFIASDAGMHFFDAAGITPREIVGDFDSANVKVLQKYREDPAVRIHTYDPKKDYTDTELALRLALTRGADEIHILGTTGTRLDHMLGTVHVLGLALLKNVPCFLIDPYNRLSLIGEGKTVLKKERQYGKYVSLIPLTTRALGVTLKGFLYPLQDGTLDAFQSLGLSNEIIEDEASVEIREGVVILAESSDKAVDIKGFLNPDLRFL